MTPSRRAAIRAIIEKHANCDIHHKCIYSALDGACEVKLAAVNDAFTAVEEAEARLAEVEKLLLPCPDVNEKALCLVCGYMKRWRICHHTGVTVCMDCADARHRLAVWREALDKIGDKAAAAYQEVGRQRGKYVTVSDTDTAMNLLQEIEGEAQQALAAALPAEKE